MATDSDRRLQQLTSALDNASAVRRGDLPGASGGRTAAGRRDGREGGQVGCRLRLSSGGDDGPEVGHDDSGDDYERGQRQRDQRGCAALPRHPRRSRPGRIRGLGTNRARGRLVTGPVDQACPHRRTSARPALRRALGPVHGPAGDGGGPGSIAATAAARTVTVGTPNGSRTGSSTSTRILLLPARATCTRAGRSLGSAARAADTARSWSPASAASRAPSRAAP